MFCRKCGSELREGSKFCMKCGSAVILPANASVNGTAASEPQAHAQKNPVQQVKPVVAVDMEPPAEEVKRRKRFGKEEQYCSICNTNLTFSELSDGYICDVCKGKTLQLPQKYKTVSVANIHEQIKMKQIIDERGLRFKTSDSVEPYFAIDKTNKLVKVIIGRYAYVYLPWDEIISFQLLEDGKVVSRRGVGGALVGGALLGATGAVIGSAAGSKHKEKATEIAVKIVTRNEFYPQIKVDLINSSVKNGGRVYKNATANAQKILTLLTVIADSVQTTQSGTASAAASPAEEIKKYKDLMDEGVISQEEFDVKKAQLLGI